ncbi:sulfate adenylyltransferase subunit CysN [Janthinobacterium sp. GB4P2]|uniref:sulfate adenylyltransferase subunit CysN n=1 Tax=Janthinobacterium sp. GB4P2 TaxID=3424189 RepID=UPI003F206774
MVHKLKPIDAHAQVPVSMEQFLSEQQKVDLLRFITCGSVDDGKSTLIGRLLWEAKHLFDDQLTSLQADSRRFGTQGDDIDFALLVDGLAAEREQGITIDVAYRYFTTARRRFIVADTPGHEQYTRNMATGASTADLAILLVDAGQGLLTQTRRHAYLVSLLGIKHVVLAVNKMDRIDYQPEVFRSIEADFAAFAKPLGFASIHAIPMSALKGDNIIERSVRTTWYNGPTLMGLLDSIDVAKAVSQRFAFSVQYVNRPDSSFRGYSGTVLEGRIKVGDDIRVTGSGQTARVAQLVTMDGPLHEAAAGDAVTICLDHEIAVSRGDVMALSSTPLEMTDQFEADIVWMHAEEGLSGRSYELKLNAQWTAAAITSIKYKVDMDSLSQVPAPSLTLNDIAVCTVATVMPVVYDTYKNSQELGSFILVDRLSQATLAAGMIRHTLRRAQNVHHQPLSIARADRERLNGHCGQVVWFTGLSGSGKSTLANALEVALHQHGRRTYILDGDNVRQGLNKDLGFTDADRVENLRRIVEVAKLMADAGLIVMTALISPFLREREMAKELIGAERFIEVYVSTPLEVCESRDVKGLYRRAREGELPNMTGIGSPYEVPPAPAFTLSTGEMTKEEAIAPLLEYLLNGLGF